MKRSTAILALSLLSGCAASEAPDKTLTGGILGAGWGAGTGAIIGHQLSYAGEGMLVGAGLGLLSGALTGSGYDVIDSKQLELERELGALRMANASNSHSLAQLQQQLDYPTHQVAPVSFHKVLFDSDVTSLRAGASKELEVIAESLLKNPYAQSIIIRGHTDDTGNEEYNKQLAEERAESVYSYLLSRGISSTRLTKEVLAAESPIGSNNTPEGRAMNRRVEIIISATS